MSIVVTTAATTAATSAAVAANNAAAAARRKAQCDALMTNYQHNTATLEMQQAYAACVPKPDTGEPMVDPKVVVALFLLAVPIGVLVALSQVRDEGVGMAGAAGLIAAIGWCAALLLLGIVVDGVRFLFA